MRTFYLLVSLWLDRLSRECIVPFDRVEIRYDRDFASIKCYKLTLFSGLKLLAAWDCHTDCLRLSTLGSRTVIVGGDRIAFANTLTTSST